MAGEIYEHVAAVRWQLKLSVEFVTLLGECRVLLVTDCRYYLAPFFVTWSVYLPTFAAMHAL